MYLRPDSLLEQITLVSSEELEAFAANLIKTPVAYGIYGHHFSAPALGEVQGLFKE